MLNIFTMGGDSSSSIKPSNLTIFISIFVLLQASLHVVICQQCGVCPSSPPPLPLPPLSPSPSSSPSSSTNCSVCKLVFQDKRLEAVYPVIQKFKATITADPLGITNSWVGSDICCGYRGFYCDIPPDNLSACALAAIDFNGYYLAAPTLEGFLDQLPDLAIFHANSNNFSGIVPTKITQFPYFYELDISNNNFSGEFPTVVNGLSNNIGQLLFLDIRYNSFTGSVPSRIFDQQNLDVLFLNNNKFMQPIPENLGSSRVLYLTLANNLFTGPIPRSLGNASSTLLEVLLLNNRLTGCIPYEIGYLTNTTLFDVSNNYLTGPLPCSLGCLNKIELLNFAGNFLYGAIPEVICALPSLSNLSLSDNYFNYVGPLCAKLVKSGILDVRKNCIHGLPDQRSPWECIKFYWSDTWWPCPHPHSYSFIPCKIYHSAHGLPPKTPISSVTYPTLHRRRF